MALAQGFRRAATSLSSFLLKDRRSIAAICSSSSSFSSLVRASIFQNPSAVGANSVILRRTFRSSVASSRKSGFSGEGEGNNTIDPDEILFPGCDYNHWLITMDFPKDPKPTPEEMVETYVQTLAKVVGSVEEAKKTMYACSTTTYTGFQAVMSEEMSEKFRGLPGVVFILPDSYIDPENKEYGGDKYDNGVITPRPPPYIAGRRNRGYDRRNEYDQRDRSGRNYNQQQNFAQSGQDGRGYGPPGNRDSGPQGGRSDFGPPRDRRNFGPPPPPPRGDFNPGGNFVPHQGGFNEGGNSTPQQGGFNQGGNFVPQQGGFNQGGNFVPQQGGFNQGGNFVPQQRGSNQGGNFVPQQRNFNQGGQFVPQEPRQYPQQGQGGDYRPEGPPTAGQYGQGSDPGFSRDHRQYGSEYNSNNRQAFGEHGGDNMHGSNNQASGSSDQDYSNLPRQSEPWQGRN